MVVAVNGYVTDVVYLRGFFRELAPAWLDFAATISGIAPPARAASFAWCELGCGQGVTTVMMAATHPHDRFVGIDLMPEHIDHARRLAAEAGVGNVSFHAGDFADEPCDLPRFDYIVAHGVYSWVGAATQAALRRFIDRHLRSGGLAYLSYNAMPGWAVDLPFQRLLFALGRNLPGDSAARFASAAKAVRMLVEADAPSLTAGTLASQIDELEARLSPAYLVHEYMVANWQPLFVTEVRAAMAEIGLVPAGSAILAENFNSFVLRRAEQKALKGFADGDSRELARDFLRNQRFRRDVYSRGGDEIDDDERRARLAAMRYALVQPVENVEYSATIEGTGRLSFDNDTARAIVAALAAGPRSLADMIGDGVEAQDVLANLIALCSAGPVRPVDLGDAPVGTLNRAICLRVDGPEALGHLALPCGTAVLVEPAVMRALRDGTDRSNPSTANWLRFLTAAAGTN